METINNLNNFSDLIEVTPELRPLADMITSIMELPDDTLNETAIESIRGMIEGAITPKMRKQMIDSVLKTFRDNNYSRGDARHDVEQTRNAFIALIEELKPSAPKYELLNSTFDIILSAIEESANIYLAHDIVLPITLDEGAQEPTYAHDTDAAADLYARETTIIPAHSFSNKIDTGVHIGLPEGWLAHIAPRSSIGAKTPLRLSNMLGVIDAGYRGPLIVMFDNLSDFDYTINVGDRIAQLWITPSYRFKAEIVDTLDETERGEGGLGSSGK